MKMNKTPYITNSFHQGPYGHKSLSMKTCEFCYKKKKLSQFPKDKAEALGCSAICKHCLEVLKTGGKNEVLSLD